MHLSADLQTWLATRLLQYQPSALIPGQQVTPFRDSVPPTRAQTAMCDLRRPPYGVTLRRQVRRLSGFVQAAFSFISIPIQANPGDTMANMTDAAQLPARWIDSEFIVKMIT